MASSLKLTRDQLASFLKDHRQIRAFENLFGVAEEVINVNLDFVASNSAAQNNSSTKTDYIDLPVRGPHVTQPRRIQWNEDDGTVDIGLYGDSVLQVGQEIMYYAKNRSGATITNGTPVMFTGTVGASGKLEFGKAVADGTYPSEYMMGVATQDIANNAFGYITSFGLVRGFNTTGSPYSESWSDGDLLYFDPATPGTWTNVKPAAPNLKIPVAVVINAGPGGSGSIFVRMQVEEALNDLQDVEVSSVSNNDILVYNNVNSRWENYGPIAARDALGLGTGSPSNGQVLIGNGTDFTTAAITPGANISITNGSGSVTIALSATITAGLTDNTSNLIASSASLGNGAGAGAGTLTNAPTAGNPTKWIPINDNGTTRYIPAW